MKKLILSFVTIAIASLQTFATVRTVSNAPNSPGQYTDLQTAINASAIGDTVYIHPSATSYGNITLYKRITLIGAGYDGTTYQYGLIATVSNISLDQVSSLNNSSGSHIISLNCSTIHVNSGKISDSVVIERCNTNSIQMSGSSSKGWHVLNCFSNAIHFGENYGNIVENNIIRSFVSHSNNTGNNIVRNNIIWYSSSVVNGSYTTYFNNIFICSSSSAQDLVSNPSATANHNNNFSNNLFYNYNTPIPPAFNNGGTNIINQDPLFVNVPNFNGVLPNNAPLIYDFRLLASSPGHNFGTDGTDIGIYGGNYPWMNPQGLSWLPQALYLNINNPVVPVNGTLNIDSRGVKRN